MPVSLVIYFYWILVSFHLIYSSLFTLWHTIDVSFYISVDAFSSFRSISSHFIGCLLFDMTHKYGFFSYYFSFLFFSFISWDFTICGCIYNLSGTCRIIEFNWPFIIMFFSFVFFFILWFSKNKNETRTKQYKKEVVIQPTHSWILIVINRNSIEKKNSNVNRQYRIQLN